MSNIDPRFGIKKETVKGRVSEIEKWEAAHNAFDDLKKTIREAFEPLFIPLLDRLQKILERIWKQ
jgi:hypothetical protein